MRVCGQTIILTLFFSASPLVDSRRVYRSTHDVTPVGKHTHQEFEIDARKLRLQTKHEADDDGHLHDDHQPDDRCEKHVRSVTVRCGHQADERDETD